MNLYRDLEYKVGFMLIFDFIETDDLVLCEKIAFFVCVYCPKAIVFYKKHHKKFRHIRKFLKRS